MKRMITGAVIAAFAVLGLSTGVHAAPPFEAAQNRAAYWEAFTPEDDTCTKVELLGSPSTYTLPSLGADEFYTLLVLKAGSGSSARTVISYPVAGTAYDHDTGKELGHIVYCVGATGQNTAPYWEAFTPEDDTCTKVELLGSPSTYTLPAVGVGQVYTLLVLTAGSGLSAHTVIWYPVAGVAYDHDTGGGLEHVIHCVTEQPSNLTS